MASPLACARSRPRSGRFRTSCCAGWARGFKDSTLEGPGASAAFVSRPGSSEDMKQKTIFACQECGAQSPKWLGRCADCGAWNSLVEERQLPQTATAAAAAGAPRYSLAA